MTEDEARAILLNPEATAQNMFDIAQDFPDLRVQVAQHPATYPGLLDWLDQYGDDSVRAAVAYRRSPVPPAPPASPPSPAPACDTGTVPLSQAVNEGFSASADPVDTSAQVTSAPAEVAPMAEPPMAEPSFVPTAPQYAQPLPAPKKGKGVGMIIGGVGTFILCCIIQAACGSSMFESTYYPRGGFEDVLIEMTWQPGWVVSCGLLIGGIIRYLVTRNYQPNTTVYNIGVPNSSVPEPEPPVDSPAVDTPTPATYTPPLQSFPIGGIHRTGQPDASKPPIQEAAPSMPASAPQPMPAQNQNSAVSGALRTFFKVGAKDAEKEMTTHMWSFTTTAQAGDIISRLNQFINGQTGMYKFYLLPSNDPSQIMIGHGLKVMSQFDTRLTFLPNGDKLVVYFQIVNWIQTNGVSPNTAKMEALLTSVRDIFTSADPNVVIERFDA